MEIWTQGVSVLPGLLTREAYHHGSQSNRNGKDKLKGGKIRSRKGGKGGERKGRERRMSKMSPRKVTSKDGSRMLF